MSEPSEHPPALPPDLAARLARLESALSPDGTLRCERLVIMGAHGTPRIVASDDTAAQEVMADAVAEVAFSIAVLQDVPPLPVTFIGGLGSAHAERLVGRWEIALARGSALDGALMLAREAA